MPREQVAGRRTQAEVFRLMGEGCPPPAYAPDLVTPLETLRAAILWQMEQAAKMAEPQPLKRAA